MTIAAGGTEFIRRLATLGEAIEDGCPPVVFAYLFGSAATGRLHARSDVDLAIHVEPRADAQRAQLDVAHLAAAHMGTDSIDVVLLNTAPLSLAGRILGTRRVIVDREPFERHRYESLTARMFQDFRIREHRILEARFGRG